MGAGDPRGAVAGAGDAERTGGEVTMGRMAQVRPFYEDVQAHYDLSNEFFALFLDSSMTYSCAYFEPADLSLEAAQRAKVDLSLGKCDLAPGRRLLDIGCGWGGTVERAVEVYRVEAIGLTLSREQQAYAARRVQPLVDGGASVEIRLQGWEEFDEPVDRIVSIGAFEHFRKSRYPAFFETCRRLLAPDGRMMLHTIVMPGRETLAAQGIAVEHEHVLFAKFIGTHIFPGGQLCPPELVSREAEAAGFTVEHTQALRPHYARTLDAGAANLDAARDRAARLTSPETVGVYMRYLTGCADFFRSGHLDVVQFVLR